jgi:hypothetical protein
LKVIRFLKPKEVQTDARFCDLCSAKPSFRTANHAYFVCSSCANKHNFRVASSQFKAEPLDLIEINETHISQVCAQKPVQTKPIRSRKRDYDAFQRNLNACRADALASASESNNADLKQSAQACASNQRLLKKYFSDPQ